MQAYIDADEVFQKYAMMVQGEDEVLYIEDIENMFKNSPRVNSWNQVTNDLRTVPTLKHDKIRRAIVPSYFHPQTEISRFCL